MSARTERRLAVRSNTARRAPDAWRFASTAAIVLTCVVTAASHTRAQTLGTFRWQLQPFCNVITVAVTKVAEVYTLDGFDDQCGGTRTGVVGVAFLNADGSVGIGLTTVAVAGGAPIHLEARVDLASVSGTWQDSAGSTGAFIFTPGAGTGGALRPPPLSSTGVVLAGSSSGSGISGGSGGGGTTSVDLSGLQTRVTGVCPVGQYLRGIRADGSVLCEPLLVDNVTTTVDIGSNGSDVGLYTSIAIPADGLPVISHYDSDNQDLRVTKCGNAACSSGNTSTTVDSIGDVGWFTSLEIGTDGLPIISYHDRTQRDLRITHCGNAACTAGNITTVPDTLGDVGSYSSIAIGADGLPIISYRDASNGDLRVLKCGNGTCTANNGLFKPAAGGRSTSIAIGSDSLPVISYESNGSLFVLHCGTHACNGNNVVTLVDATSVVDATSIAIGRDGFPVVSYHDSTNHNLRFAKCSDEACAGTTISTLESANDVGAFPAIAIGIDAAPIVGHYDLSFTDLRVLHCGNGACNTGNVGVSLKDPWDVCLDVGATPSIAIGLDGLPIFSYYDRTHGDLRVTKCATRTCQ